MSDIIRKTEKFREDVDRISKILSYSIIKVVAEEFPEMGMYPGLYIVLDCLELARYRIVEMMNKVKDLADATLFIPEDVEDRMNQHIKEFIEKTYKEVDEYLEERSE